MKEMQCAAVMDNLRPVLAMASEEMIARSTEISVRQRLFVVLEELFNNVALHAYAQNPSPGPVHICLTAEEDFIRLRIEDQGIPFNPLEKDDASRLANLDNMQEGGEGIFLVKTLTSSFTYEFADGWNKIEVEITGQGV